MDSGVDAVLLGQAGYPARLASSPEAPATLFIKGPHKLLEQRAIGMCGSRHASSEGLRAAHACADAVARRGYSVVSGYAKGVDLVAHSAALASGGTTVIVLAEGINRFRIRRGEFEALWDSERAVVVSQFPPDQKWFASGAMTRNTVISGLSEALVVVEAGEKGGTVAAGEYALRRGQTVLTLELFDAPPGNQLLMANGAKVIRSRQHLEAALDYLDADGTKQLTLM
jgi:DNA processing protein